MKLSLLACIGASMMAVTTAQAASGSAKPECTTDELQAIYKAIDSQELLDVCGAEPATTMGELADLPICDDKKCRDYATALVDSFPDCTENGIPVKNSITQLFKVCDQAEENGSPAMDGFGRALGVAAFASFVALQAIL